MRKLTDEEALTYGIQPIHHQMDNGEQRFRLTRDTGSSYILTLSAHQSGSPVTFTIKSANSTLWNKAGLSSPYGSRRS